MKCSRCAVGVGCLLWILEAAGSPVVLYETGFEASEGYDRDRDLDGQKGWLGLFVAEDFNTGLIDALPGLGELSAYIGAVAPLIGESSFYVWQPLNPAPDPEEIPWVRFSAVVEVVDSTNPDERDDFCWEVYNQREERLFTLIFNNYDQGVYYVLETSTNSVFTGFEFQNEVRYDLDIEMDFHHNRWLAKIDGVTIVSNVPISELGSELNLGDVDAAWVYGDLSAPGDNFMVFDNYRIEGIPASARATVRFVERLVDGRARVEVQGQPGWMYALEASNDLVSWTVIATVPGGLVEVTDPQAPAFSSRFYRAHVVP